MVQGYLEGVYHCLQWYTPSRYPCTIAYNKTKRETMPQRKLSETGWYHVTTRTAGQIALFEDDIDRKKYLSLLRHAHEELGVRIIAWMLMTDHVHLVVDVGEDPQVISGFMHSIDLPYSKYFNSKTGRSGTLFQGAYWSRPILTDAQLVATVHYVHMNPERAGIAPMRSYRWSSYREYAGTHWIVDTTPVIEMFGSFEAFDAYEGSPKDVIRKGMGASQQDGDVLDAAMRLAGVQSSDELRKLPVDKRNELIRALAADGASTRKIARALGIGHMTVSRALT